MRIFALLSLAWISIFAQTTGATFEVVSIKPSPPPDGRGFMRGCKGGPASSDPGMWQCTNATVSMLVLRAYNLKHYQLIAPDWVADTNFEIGAKLAADASKEQFREMIQNLLTERFKLEFHRGKKEMGGYDLVVAKGGAKLTPSVDRPPGDPKNEPPGFGSGGRGPANDDDGYPNIPSTCNGCMTINAAGKARYHAHKETVQALAEWMANQLGMPVSDRTELAGEYDITLSWNSGGGISRRSETDVAADPGLSMEAAVLQQLGLKLESRKVTVDTIVIDKAEKSPVEN